MHFLKDNILSIFFFKFFVWIEELFELIKKYTSTPDKIFLNNLPKHVAVIMDGNRRYGIKKHKDELLGHFDGAQKLCKFISWCVEEKIETATVYAFSSENWSRSVKEIDSIMNIFEKFIDTFSSEAVSKNIRIRFISTEVDKIPDIIKLSSENLELLTKDCDGFLLNICLSYGGQDDILCACKKITDEIKTSKDPENIIITKEYFRSKLSSCDISDPDLLIRTSSELRISNFLPWQLAYTELFFIDKYWPEITQKDFQSAINNYSNRKIRRGI
jgi:undecaprenyl diphosphate synthase